MPNARELHCQVIEFKWLTSTVMSIRIRAKKTVHFDAGQFVAVKVPNGPKRLYSFASPPSGLLKPNEFELCVKFLPGGKGSEYLSHLKAGDPIEIWSPYGDFVYETDPSRSACFIATGTGVAPMRSIVLSEHFRNDLPKSATLLFGARDLSEILYPGEFEKAGCKVVYALSQAQAGLEVQSEAQIFRGRITGYLESLPKYSNFRETDFYLCGNNEMIADVTAMLIQAFGVQPSAIHAEAFGASMTPVHQLSSKKRAA